MKISNELKVGLLALLAIFLLVWGYNFLKGKDIFSSKKVIYAEYKDVFGLTKSATVKISGINIGLVSNIRLKDDGSQLVVVEMEIDKDIEIPKNAIAQLVDVSIMGGKAITLFYTGTCEGGDCVQSGDILIGQNVGMIEGMTGDLKPYISKAQEGWQTIDSTIKSFTSGGGGGDMQVVLDDFKKILANLSTTTQNLNRLIAASSGDISGTLKNVNKLSAGLAASDKDIQNALANVSKFTGRLENLELEATVDSTQMTFASINHSLATLDGAILDIQKIVNNMNSGEGTVAKLLNDDAIYKELEKTIQSINLLTEDLRLHPKRYTRVLSKKEIPYKEPKN